MSCRRARPRGPPNSPSDATATPPPPRAAPRSAVGVTAAAASAVRTDAARGRGVATLSVDHGGRVAGGPSTRAAGAPTHDRALPTP